MSLYLQSIQIIPSGSWSGPSQQKLRVKDARQQKEEAKAESLGEIFMRIEGCQCYLTPGK